MHGLRVGSDAFKVDVIAIAVGRQADPALATMAGVPLAFAAALGGLVPVVDEWLQAPGGKNFVAGDAAGAGSVAAAIAEGRLAGAAAAARLGLMNDDDVVSLRVSDPELAARAALRASLQPVFAQPYEGSDVSWPTP